MRIGLVTKWAASGQAVVARQIRSALDGLGHDTSVLVRPGSGPRAQRAADAPPDPVWDQPGVTEASEHEIPTAEYERWAEDNDLELILFDENYQWEAVAALRNLGIRTVGRFVWEYFAPEHVEPAKAAYETIYSLHRAERDRYATMGIESPYVQWGIHPELLRPTAPAGAGAADQNADPAPDSGEPGRAADAPAGAADADPAADASSGPGETGRAAEVPASAEAEAEAADPAPDAWPGPGGTGRAAEDSPGVVLYFPGSFLGRRKPIRKVIKAFGKARGDHLRLLINAQVPRNDEMLRDAAEEEPRIELMLDDEPEEVHRARFAACDVCLAPSRWEGLGLPLYEATAFGLPIITNDRPPMSEMVIDGASGILVPSVQNGTARSGIPAWDPEIGALTTAIERLGDREELERMRVGVAELRDRRGWSRTVADLESLIGG